MSDWGDDDPGIDAQVSDVDADTAQSYERREPGRAFGIDIGELTRELVAGAFQKAIQTNVTTVVSKQVEEAVGDALTDDLTEDLHIRAGTAAADAVAEQLASIDDDPGADGVAPELYFGSVDEFVREYLISAYRRRIDGQHRVWAARWWEYDEAVIRLEALWRAWETLRQDASTGMSVWWRDHADHHMAVLMSPDGPFAGLKESDENRNKKGEPLPYEAPPEGLFPDVRVDVDGG